jgi:hypothetical protein
MQRGHHSPCDSHHREHLLHDPLGVRELVVFDEWGIDGRSIDGADALDRGVELIEGVLLDEMGDHRRDAAERLRFIDKDDSVGFGDGGEDGVHIEWADRAEVEDFGADAVLF